MATAPELRPELESGDRLSQTAFHRRYEARPDIWKAELINGVVYVAPPRVSFRLHGEPVGFVNLWCGMFAAYRPGVTTSIRPSIILSDDSEVQPDVRLAFEPGTLGAELRLRPDDYLEGTPELVVEIAASGASYDLHDKKEAYRLAGVLEYIVWRVLDEAIDWFRLRDGAYVLIEPDANGMIDSAVFPGLRLDVPAMLAGDRAAVLAALRPAQ